MLVCDLRHFLGMPGDASGSARRLAEHLTDIVRAATAGDSGQAWVSALPCRRRPGRQPCRGHLALVRTDVPQTIEWSCTVCGDDGVLRGWEGSPFDLRRRGIDPASVPTVEVEIPADVAATLRRLLLIDSAGERIVFRARPTDDGIILAADADGLEELLDHVAAESNHEENRHRRKALDRAFAVLRDAVEQEL